MKYWPRQPIVLHFLFITFVNVQLFHHLNTKWKKNRKKDEIHLFKYFHIFFCYTVVSTRQSSKNYYTASRKHHHVCDVRLCLWSERNKLTTLRRIIFDLNEEKTNDKQMHKMKLICVLWSHLDVNGTIAYSCRSHQQTGFFNCRNAIVFLSMLFLWEKTKHARI